MAETVRVIIDAGHGGAEPGAIYQNRREKDDTLRLALAVGQILSENGVDVAYTRVTDVYQSPLEKAQMANRWDGDFFLSIHRNAMPVPGSASGIESLIYQKGGAAEMLAGNINQALEQAGFANLGISERPGLIVLRRTDMPAVLVEAGFLDNEADNRFFDEHFNHIAQAIADGVLATVQEQQEPEYYQIQVGAFENRDDAEQLLNRLTRENLPAFMVHDEDSGLYKVRVGAYLNLDNAAWMEKTLRSMGYPTMMVRERAVY